MKTLCVAANIVGIISTIVVNATKIKSIASKIA